MLRSLFILLAWFSAGIAAADEQRDIMATVARVALPGTSIAAFEKLDSVYVGTGPITDKDLTLLAKLPALESLNFIVPLPEAGLEQLKAGEALRGLHFSRVKLSANQLREIGAIPQLENLSFDYCELAEEGLLSLGNLKKLRSLSIFPSTATAVRGCAKAGVLFATWYCEDEQGDSFANSQEVRKLYCDETFGDEALAACRFPQLRTVSLPPQATDKTLACLAAWPELESLTVRSPHVSNASLKAICNATKLRRLDLRGTSITARGLAELKKLKHLQELVPPQSNLAMLQALQEAQLLPLLAHREVRGTTLDLNGKRTTNASLELLDDQLNVQTIILDVSQITDAGLKHLAKNKSVQEISLNSAMRLRGMEFQELAVLPKLQVLRLIYTDIDDRAGDGLATLTSLRELELNHTKVTAAIVPKLLPLERLTHLRLPDKALDDANLELLAKHRRLHTLQQFWRNMQPAENDLQIASARLELTAATEKSLNLLRKFPLKSLICPAKMTDDGLVIIGSFPQLESLVLSRQQGITDAGLKHLSNLKTLQSITLEGTNISDAGIQHLRGLTELTRLALDNTKVGDETLRLAETMPKLKQISVHGTKVSVAALRRFDKARPDCALGAPFFVRER